MSKSQSKMKKMRKSLTCPVCSLSFNMGESMLNHHIDQCLSQSSRSSKQTTSFVEEDEDKDVPVYNIIRGPIKGLYFVEDFLTAEEEIMLVDSIDRDQSRPWKHSNFNGHCDGKSWGIKTEHANKMQGKSGFVRLNDTTKGEANIPTYMETIIARIHALRRSFQITLDSKIESNDDLLVLQDFRTFSINECNANSYEKSKCHFLRPHVDDRQLSGPLLANLSLVSDCFMRFNMEKTGRDDYIDVLLKRRTLQIVSGIARYDYEHSIPFECFLGNRRVSITFRQAGGKRTGVRGLPLGAGASSTPSITTFTTASTHSHAKKERNSAT